MKVKIINLERSLFSLAKLSSIDFDIDLSIKLLNSIKDIREKVDLYQTRIRKLASGYGKEVSPGSFDFVKMENKSKFLDEKAKLDDSEVEASLPEEITLELLKSVGFKMSANDIEILSWHFEGKKDAV